MLHASKMLFTGFIALSIVACGGSGPSSTIVRVPASELPALGPSTLAGGDAFPTVTTIDGSKHTLGRPIERVEIELKKHPIPISLPFKARIQGDELEVLTDQVRTYHVPDISYVEVQHAGAGGGISATQNRNKGGGLILGSLPVMALGTVLIVADSGHNSGGAVNLGGVFTLLGGALVVVGAGLFIAGVSASSSAPTTTQPTAPATKPPTKTTFVRPRLRVSPTGASFSAEF